MKVGGNVSGKKANFQTLVSLTRQSRQRIP
jgi:hypothetical protein